ncbi:uncharacterized protein LOC135209593 [Macrobrachium nipponense]|uniref:uncharacterized protein LOC135209593 n=1 Tax=Macrobrachium nipponense TaxID=159736 RepID=UPI0030C7EB5F
MPYGGEAVKKEVHLVIKNIYSAIIFQDQGSVIQIKLESVVDGCQTETVKNESPLEDSGAYKTNEVDVGGMSEAVRVILKSEASKYGELKCDLKPGEFINIEAGEEALSSGVTSYQIDYSNIKSFVLCETYYILSFGNISLKCTKVNKKVFVKPFECSTLGLGDKEALANIQNFINSNECIRRLAVVEKLDSTNISEFIAEEPRLTRMSDEYVRLVCTYEGGRTTSQRFSLEQSSVSKIRLLVKQFKNLLIVKKEGTGS